MLAPIRIHPWQRSDSVAVSGVQHANGFAPWPRFADLDNGLRYVLEMAEIHVRRAVYVIGERDDRVALSIAR